MPSEHIHSAHLSGLKWPWGMGKAHGYNTYYVPVHVYVCIFPVLIWFSPAVIMVQLLYHFQLCVFIPLEASVFVRVVGCSSSRHKNRWREGTAAGDTSPNIWEEHGGEHTDVDTSKIGKQICTCTLTWTYIFSFFCCANTFPHPFFHSFHLSQLSLLLPCPNISFLPSSSPSLLLLAIPRRD